MAHDQIQALRCGEKNQHTTIFIILGDIERAPISLRLLTS